jgi:hypothetical protein
MWVKATARPPGSRRTTSAWAVMSAPWPSRQEKCSTSLNSLASGALGKACKNAPVVFMSLAK